MKHLTIIVLFLMFSQWNILAQSELLTTMYADLEWEKSELPDFNDPELFQVQIASDKEFQNIESEGTVEISRYVSSKKLKLGKIYFWRVRSVNKRGAGKWIVKNNFKVIDYSMYTENIYAHHTIEQVREAFERAKRNAPSTIRLQENVVWRDTVHQKLIDVSDYKNVWFDGNEKTITLSFQPQGLFQFKNAENIVLSDFSVEFSRDTYASGKIVKIDPERREITLKSLCNGETRCVEINDPLIQTSRRPHARLVNITPSNEGEVLYGEETYIHFGSSQQYDRSYEENGVLFHVLKLNPKGKKTAGEFKIGQHVIIVPRGLSNNIFRAQEGKNFVLKGITVTGSDSQFASSIFGRNLVILDCKILLAAGSYSSLNADAVYVRQNFIGPWVENSTFLGNGDDCMNLHSIGIAAESQIDHYTIKLSEFNLDRFSIGDQVIIWDPYPGSEEPIYTKVDSIDTILKRVVFKDSIGKISIEDPHDRGTLVYNTENTNSKFYLKNNTIKSNARFGLLISSTDGAVVDNNFERCASSAIRIGNYPGEGLIARNLLIKGNYFKDCGYTGEYLKTGALIDIGVTNTAHQEIPLRLHSNITFTQNIIENWEHIMVAVRSINGFNFIDNQVISTKPKFSPLALNNVLYLINNSENVIIEDNQILDARDWDTFLAKDTLSTRNIRVEKLRK